MQPTQTPDQENKTGTEYNPSKRDYQDKFAKLKSLSSAQQPGESLEDTQNRLRNRDAAAAETPAATASPAGLERQESEPSLYSETANPDSLARKLAKRALKRWATGIGLGAVGAIVTALSTGILGFFVNLKEMSLDFFTKNHYAAYSKRTKSLQDRIFSEPGENCKLSIRCRLKPGVSDKEIQKYKDAGFDVETDENANGDKYIKKLTAKVGDKEIEITKENFKEIYEGTSKAASAAESLVVRARFWSTGSKPKALVWRATNALFKFAQFHIDRSFFADTIQKFREYVFGGGGKDIAVKGPADEESNDPKTNAIEEDLKGVDDSIAKGAEEEKARIANGGAPGVEIDPGALNGAPDTAPAVAEAAAGGAKGTVKSAAEGVLSAIDYACTGYSILRTVTLAAKVYRYASLILFAMTFLTEADALKVGGTVQDSNGKTVTASSALPTYATALVRPSTQTDSQGKTSADSGLFTLVTENKISNIAGLAFGVMGFPLLGFLQGAMKLFQSLGANADNCKQVLSWYGQAFLIGAGLLSAIFSEGGTTVGGIVISVGLGMVISGIISYATPFLIKAIAGDLAPDLAGPGGSFAVGNAIAGGIGGFAAELGKAGGLAPVSKSQASTIFNQTNTEMAKINAIDQIGKSPFSLDTPNSITSRLAMALFPMTAAPFSQTNYQGLADLAMAPFSIVGNAVNQLFNNQVGALSTSYGGEYCADDDLNSIGVATDAYCNPIYGLDDATIDDPQYQPDKVMDYMINNGYVNESDGSPAATDNGNAYKKFVDSCITGTEPLTPDGAPIDIAGGGDTDTRLCLHTDQQANMFRLFTMDQNILDGMDASINGTLGQSQNSGSGGPTTNIGDVVYYSQLDPHWAKQPYLGGTIYTSGCGPTSMAMIVSTLTGQRILPSEMATYFTDQGWADSSQGTLWQGIIQAPKKWNLPIGDELRGDPNSYLTDAEMQSKVIPALKSGKLLIVSGDGKGSGSAIFSPVGHFIVIRGIAPDGNFLINDPNNFVDSNGNPVAGSTSLKEWPASEFESTVTGVWAFTK